MAVADDKKLAEVLYVVEEILREKGKENGAALGGALRRRFPGFDPTQFGVSSLSGLLRERGSNFVVVGRSGADLWWSLGERLSDRLLQDALSATADDTAGVPTVPVNVGTLSSIRLQDFRACKNTVLTLSSTGLTVLVGSNGSGKTSLLRAISFLAQVTQGRLAAVFSGPRDLRILRTVGSKRPVELEVTTNTGARMLIRGNVGEDSVSFDGVVTTPDGTKPEPWKWPGPPPKPSLASRPISRLLWPCVLLRFRSEELAAPSDVTEGEPRIDYDGYGLASLLAYLANNDPGRLERLVKGVAELVPGVLRTRQKAVTRPGLPTEGERAERILQYQFEVEMEGLGWIRADMLSEGTLFAFGMHAVLEQPIPPQLVLVDDIDRGLHPRAQRTLIRQLKELAEKKHVCLVVTTHSPYVLDELPAEAVRVVRSCGEAGTRVRPLTEHPDWAEWKENMTGGEFWAFVGEDWLETPS